MSITSKKVTVTFLDQHSAETIGWPLRYAADRLGVWQDKTEEELFPLFNRWLNRSMYGLSVIWKRGKKDYRIFKRGFTISDQIDTAVALIASRGRIEIDFHEILEHVKFKQICASEDDVQRTFYHNMRDNWLSSDADRDYWTQFLSADTLVYPPVLPSSRSNALKSGFDKISSPP